MTPVYLEHAVLLFFLLSPLVLLFLSLSLSSVCLNVRPILLESFQRKGTAMVPKVLTGSHHLSGLTHSGSREFAEVTIDAILNTK